MSIGHNNCVGKPNMRLGGTLKMVDSSPVLSVLGMYARVKDKPDGVVLDLHLSSYSVNNKFKYNS